MKLGLGECGAGPPARADATRDESTAGRVLGSARWLPASPEAATDPALDFLLACAACAVPLDFEHYQDSRRARSRSSARRVRI